MAAATLLSHHSPLSAPLFKEARDAWAQDPIIGYDEVKQLSQQPTDAILLVDVREPDENALGSIPSAVNLPLSRLDDALAVGFNPGAFQQVSRHEPSAIVP
jgi:3-mercaptopyruvate sulfurtransferase SseA